MALDELKSQGIQAIKQGMGGNSSTAGITPKSDSLSDIYEVDTTKWFKTLPYGFVFYDRLTAEEEPEVLSPNSNVFYLPISPENIQVTTHFATNVITTLYGVVEEHSPVRFYDIVISGTTGIAPQFYNETFKSPGPQNDQSFISTGRSAFDNGSFVDNLGGFLPEIANVVNQVRNTIGTLQNIADQANGTPPISTGLESDKSGYAAFHNFYRYLMKYKKDAAGVGGTGNINRPSNKLLQFLNYKDGVKYDCIPTSFNLSRSAQNPMLYNYSIKMRCYNLVSINDSVQGVTSQERKLGLVTGNSDKIESNSVFSTAASAATNAATLIGGLI